MIRFSSLFIKREPGCNACNRVLLYFNHSVCKANSF